MQITFTNLNQSDAGMYRFGLGTSVLPYAYCDVEIRVAQGEHLAHLQQHECDGKQTQNCVVGDKASIMP